MESNNEVIILFSIRMKHEDESVNSNKVFANEIQVFGSMTWNPETWSSPRLIMF